MCLYHEQPFDVRTGGLALNFFERVTYFLCAFGFHHLLYFSRNLTFPRRFRTARLSPGRARVELSVLLECPSSPKSCTSQYCLRLLFIECPYACRVCFRLTISSLPRVDNSPVLGRCHCPLSSLSLRPHPRVVLSQQRRKPFLLFLVEEAFKDLCPVRSRHVGTLCPRWWMGVMNLGSGGQHQSGNGKTASQREALAIVIMPQ